MTRQQKDKTIAAAITFVAMLIIIVALFLGGISFDSEQTAVKPVAELMPDEELFLEPEILKDLGEENAVRQDAPAEAFKGEPEHAETDNTKLVVKGDNQKPAPPVDKLVTTKKESPVQATEPSISKEEKQKVTSSVAKGFSSRNGSSEGKSGSSGAGGTGMGITGSASGRTFKGCPKPDVTLRNKTTVTVSVVIDSDGNVISAKASGGASASIRRACEQAAKGAKWSPKKGAGETRGSISFTITPR